MKATIFSIIFFLISINGSAQKDFLKLILRYEVSTGEAQLPLNIWIDFISFKTKPITYQVKPDYVLKCDLDDPRLQEEVLDGNCYKAEVKNDFHPLAGFTRAKDNFKELHYCDTATYRDYIYMLDKESVRQKSKGFAGNYRFRVSRIYTEKGRRKQIFSNWLYSNYPD